MSSFNDSGLSSSCAFAVSLFVSTLLYNPEKYAAPGKISRTAL